MKNSGFLFSALILMAFFAVLGLAVFYLARRTAFVFNMRPTWLYVGYGVLVALLIFGLGFGRAGGTMGHIAIVGGSICLGVLMCMLFATLLVDLVNLGLHFSPSCFGIIVAVLTLSATTYGLWAAATPKLETVTVELPKLTQPVDIVQWSDVHLGHFRGRENLQKLVDLTNSTSAQAVVITGDLFESRYNLSKETLAPLKALRVPIFFVDGNHDIYTNDAAIKKLLREMGVHVLENEVAHLGELQIVGLDYMSASPTEPVLNAIPGRSTIASVLPRLPIDTTRPAIMLHHYPTGVQYAEKAGIGLCLAGHTHGGQLFPVTIINHFSFQYNRGLYRFGNTQIYVSDGSGTFGPPMRFGTHSEVTLLHLSPQRK